MDCSKIHYFVSSFPLARFFSLSKPTATTEMKQDQPQLYESLMKILNPDEERVVQEIILHANAFNMAPASIIQPNGGHR